MCMSTHCLGVEAAEGCSSIAGDLRGNEGREDECEKSESAHGNNRNY